MVLSKIKNMDPVKMVLMAALLGVFITVLSVPDVLHATATTAQVKSKLKTGVTAIQSVLTGLVVVVGIIATQKIVVKHLPSIDDPHVKNEMWKAIGGVMLAVIGGAALIWIVPWIYSLFA